MTASRHVTIRGVPAEVARALKAEARRRGTSINKTANDLLRRALGLDADAPFDNGLGALAGGWSARELTEFEKATAGFEAVDDEIWR